MPFSTGTVIGLLRDTSVSMTQAITKAQATADNARQMVLNRDTALKNLQADAATLPDIINAASIEHAEMREETQAADAALGERIDNIQLMPGPVGPAGADGRDGQEGAVGPQGPPGADSTVPGPPGMDSTVPGPQGPQGTPGKDSTVPGPKGDKGDPGRDSTVAGPQGYQGVPGPAGPAGKDSTVPGPTGATGPAGPAGADGKLQTLATGSAPVPAVTLLGSQDIVITLSRTMPNTNYNVDLIVTPALLSAMSWTIKAKTTTTVTITIKALLAISAGQMVTAIATI